MTEPEAGEDGCRQRGAHGPACHLQCIGGRGACSKTMVPPHTARFERRDRLVRGFRMSVSRETSTGHAVVIAGGGPTGLMLAGELALAGVDVAVVERRASQELAG